MIRHFACAGSALPVLLLFVSIATAQQNQPAIDAAREWVSLIDEGKYAESWAKAGALFQDSISRQDWVNSLNMVRAPLGEVVSRKLKNTANVTSLPGAPEGNYLIMEFDTSFRNKSATIETITAARQADGKWQIVGYFIR
jgi:hypothetical protein